MRYVKKYESFKQEDSTNEEFLGALYNAAKGALKNFLGNIMAPFKTLKDDFKKGMKIEDIKKRMITAMDSVLKSSVNEINKSNDKEEIRQMVDGFEKQILDEIATFDEEIKSVKESNIINEGKVQDALIGGRVALDMIKKKVDAFKADFKTKFDAAKDIAAAKKEAINNITTIVNGFKKDVMNNEVFKKAEDEYRKANNITATTTTTGTGVLTLDWGDVELTIKLPVEGGTTRYEITASNSKTLAIQDKSLFCDIEGTAKVGDKVKLNNITLAGTTTPYKVATYETGALTKILLDSKEVDNYEFKTTTEGEEDGVDQTKLTADLKALNDEADKTQIKRVVKFLDFIKTKADKLPEVDKLLGGEAEATAT